MLSQQSVKCENLFAISAISKPVTSTKDSKTKSSISPQNVTAAYYSYEITLFPSQFLILHTGRAFQRLMNPCWFTLTGYREYLTVV